MHYLCMISLLIASANAFVNINHLLLDLDLSQTNVSSVEGKWIEQPLDHFDSNEKRTFKMKYYENLQFWQPKGPILVFIGGEDTLDKTWISDNDNLFPVKMAKETHGALFAAEHRYYGESVPNIPQDNRIEYFKFLNSHQALEDLANFIKMLKSDSKYKSSKVVMLGGSYAGNLAAWMRELHPELVDAALAGSAPVLAKKDFHEYLDTVRYTFEKYGTDGCLDKVKNNMKIDEDLLKTPEGIEKLMEKYTICPNVNMTVLENQQFFFSWVHFIDLETTSQNGLPHDVKALCNQMSRPRQLKIKPNWERCYNFDVSSYDMPNAFDAEWYHQACTEFGYLITTTSEKQPFVRWSPVEFLLKFCKGFAKEDTEKAMDEGIAETNKRYGGLKLNVTKVVFTHGDMDPWHPLGVLQDLGPDAPVIMTNGTSHGTIFSVRKGEPEEMKKDREHVKDLIIKWIS